MEKAFQDRERMTDVLTSQKTLTSGYNTFANEASSPAVKDTLLGILTEEHEIQHRVFTEMARRGWYETEAAEENKIEQAKTKFSGDTGSC